MVRKAINRIGPDLFEDYLLVRRADILAQSPAFQETKLSNLAMTTEYYREITAEGECVTLEDLAIGGRNLLEAGFTPRPAIGETLDVLLREVLEHPEYNEKGILLKKAVKIAENLKTEESSVT